MPHVSLPEDVIMKDCGRADFLLSLTKDNCVFVVRLELLSVLYPQDPRIEM